MKSVGLITMHRVNNCGSCLQTLATVKAVERLGYDCTVIDYLYPTVYHMLKPLGNDFAPRDFLRRFLKKLGILKYIYFAKQLRNQFHDRERIARFLTCFKHTRPVRRGDFAKLPSFDVYMTGSDQTWNARYLADDYSFLLDFVPEDVRKISYAASFGGNDILPSFRKTYAKLLSRYNAISVRESSGVDIVCDLTGKSAIWVVDPTLLLTADEWRPMEVLPDALPQRFIFCYVLSYFDPGAWFIDTINQIANQLDASVIFFCDGIYRHEAQAAGFKVLTGTLPYQEFLAYIDRAAFVITTSFHGTAFALNFHKDFFSALNPKSASDSRVGSLLKSVELQDRGLSTADDVPRLLSNLTVNYAQANIHFERLRQDSLLFLKDALEGHS